jgi:hypothetical protein
LNFFPLPHGQGSFLPIFFAKISLPRAFNPSLVVTRTPLYQKLLNQIPDFDVTFCLKGKELLLFEAAMKTRNLALLLGLCFSFVACGPSEFEKEKLAFEKKKYEDEQAAKAAAEQKQEQDKAEQKEHWMACRAEADDDYDNEFKHWGEPVAGKPSVREGPAKQLEDMKNRRQRSREACDRDFPKGRSW